MTAVVEMLREHNRRFAPSYRGGLTNHLPMCLIALARLGANEVRLRAFAEQYVKMLEPATVDARVDLLRAELRERGRDVVLREKLTQLAPGLAGAAFHGVIRVAYATLLDDDDELAHALIYALDNTLPLLPPGAGREADVQQLVWGLRDAGLEKPTGYTITDRLRVVAADDRFGRVVRDLCAGRSTLNDVSGIGARMYLAAGDFASLHVLTGAHAVRLLDRWWGVHREEAHYALAVAALACFVVAGSPRFVDARGRDRATWSEIEARALASADDHMAKLVVACLDEEAVLDDAIYRIVATQATRRGKT
jgi:hypothetical protein